MGEPLGPVVIGAREIYDAVVRVGQAVDRLTGQHADTEKVLGDYENRLRSLERRQWPLPAASVLLALVAVAISILPILIA